MRFEILGDISQVETIATASGIREISRLRKIYGRGRWRKRKGFAHIRLSDGTFHLPRYTGMRPAELAAGNSRSRNCSDMKAATKQTVVCIENEGYEASLEKRKIYVAVHDAAAGKHGLLCVIDESGEDYLYTKAFFRPIALPQALKKAVLAV